MMKALLERHLGVKGAYQKEKHVQTIKAVQTPTEGKWFEVNPTTIDQSIFSKERVDGRQEITRKRILEAFTEMKNDSKYARLFKTLIPKKTWNAMYVSELRKIACNLGDHMADWVEQALEWAQRIANGETWEAVCNNPDTANWYRLIEWKNGYTRIVGGSRKNSNDSYASDVGECDYNFNDCLYATVLLVCAFTVPTFMSK